MAGFAPIPGRGSYGFGQLFAEEKKGARPFGVDLGESAYQERGGRSQLHWGRLLKLKTHLTPKGGGSQKGREIYVGEGVWTQ